MRKSFNIPELSLTNCRFSPDTSGDDILLLANNGNDPVRFRFFFVSRDVVCRMPQWKDSLYRGLEAELLRQGFFTEAMSREYRIDTAKIIEYMHTPPPCF